MSQQEWEEDQKGYEAFILQFVKSCSEYEIAVMPIFWNGNFITEYLENKEEDYVRKRCYAAAMIKLLKEEPNILMWDICNEPLCNDYLRGAPPEEYPGRKERLVNDLRKHCELIRSIDDDTPITVGHELSQQIETTVDLVDVISFHDYMPTKKRMESAYQEAAHIASLEGGKPVLNTETGCIGRANPYNLELELCERYRCGFFLFNLIIEGFWGEIHGLVYPDGTVRDPGVIAALYGFARNKGSHRILPRGNKEGHAYKAVKAVEDALRLERKSMFINRTKGIDTILEAAEYCINILESCELVPMWDMLSVRLEKYRSSQPEAQDEWEIQKFAYECAGLLKEKFLIL